jgi:hypothetical protein
MWAVAARWQADNGRPSAAQLRQALHPGQPVFQERKGIGALQTGGDHRMEDQMAVPKEAGISKVE